MGLGMSWKLKAHEHSESLLVLPCNPWFWISAIHVGSVVLCDQPWLVPIWNHHQSVLPCYPHGKKILLWFPQESRTTAAWCFLVMFQEPPMNLLSMSRVCGFIAFSKNQSVCQVTPSVWGWKSPGFVVRYLLTFNQTFLEIPPVSSIYPLVI